MAYPATKTTFSDPSGTTRMDTGVDHAALHTAINDTLEAVQDTVGTTAGTNVLMHFTAGDLAARSRGPANNGTLQGTVNIGTAVIGNLTATNGLLTGMVQTTTSFSNGTISLSHVSGTANFAAGTLGNGVLGTPAITGGTATNLTYAGGTATSAIANIPYILDRSVTLGTVVNTAADTTIYSFSVPANTLGTAKMLRLTLYATYLQNSGGAADLTASLKYGATTLGTALSSNSAAGTAPATIQVQAHLMADGATGAQKGGFTFLGRHQPINQANVVLSGYGAATEDSTATKTLTLSIQHGAASANLSFIKNFALLEVI